MTGFATILGQLLIGWLNPALDALRFWARLEAGLRPLGVVPTSTGI